MHGYKPEKLLAGATTLTLCDAFESVRYVSIAEKSKVIAILAATEMESINHRLY